MYSFRHGNTLCTFGCNPNARPGWHPTRCSALKRLPPRAHRVRPLRLHTTVVWFPPSLQPSRTHLNKNGKRSDSDQAAIHGGAEDRLSDRRTPTATHCCPESDPRGCARGQHHSRDGVAPNIADHAGSIWPLVRLKGATGEHATPPKPAERRRVSGLREGMSRPAVRRSRRPINITSCGHWLRLQITAQLPSIENG